MPPNVMYVSPHLDDAVLSCGGLIHRQIQAGASVLIATIFAGAPSRSTLSSFAAKLHAQWGHLTDPIAARREEDRRAMLVLGADSTYLEYPDAIYRSEEISFLYPCEDALFGTLHPADLRLVSQLAKAIVEICSPPLSTIYAPLAVGNHVDHQLAREAALTLHCRSYPVIFYEDYPYVEVPGALMRGLERISIERWTEEVHFLDEGNLATKIRAIAAYGSQMKNLFQSADAMAQRVTNYARALSSEQGYAERYWRLPCAAKA